MMHATTLVVGELVIITRHILPVGIGISGILIEGFAVIVNMHAESRSDNYIDVMMRHGQYTVSLHRVSTVT
jgi:hypothetical protein